MPVLDHRAKALVQKGKNKTAGRQTVTYIDAKGRSRDALVLSAGTASGLKLAVGSTNAVIDNVPKGTSASSTGCYFAR